MALLEDALKGNPVTAIGIGVAVAAASLFLPRVRPQVASAVKSGVKLFLEAELGADHELLGHFVDATVDTLLGASAKGTEAERKEAAATVVRQFKAKARARAHRRGWDERDAQFRYRRSLSRLRHSLERERGKVSAATWEALDHAIEIASDESHPARPGPSASAGQPKARPRAPRPRLAPAAT